MKSILLTLFAIICSTAQAQNLNIIFKVNDKKIIRESNNLTGVKSLDTINSKYSHLSLRKLKTGKKSTNTTYIVSFPDTVNSKAVINAYLQTGLVEYAEVDGKGTGGGVINTQVNDVLYFRQWGLKNDGSFIPSATAGADIDMESAWEIQQGSENIAIAVMDSGLKMDHPEFTGRLWENPYEIPGNDIDDDENGYVDDVNGWDFVNFDNNPADDHGHGTNVTGIIAANGNNNIGYSGVDLNCKIMTLKGLNANNSGSYSWWVEAITYAADNGANVINLSVGGSTYSNALGEAVEYALANNVVVVVCMMNTDSNTPYYPANYPNVIAVGATNPDDKRSSPFFWDFNSGSNYGSHISVVAPGNYIYGLSAFSNTNYEIYWGGTSQATPHVTGICALLKAENPSLTPAQIKNIIEETAEDQIGNPLEDGPGFDIYYGHGRVNAYNALNSLTAGIDNNEKLNLQIYPNPSEGIVTINGNNYPLEVSVYNTVGQIIKEKILTNSDKNITLNKSGIYFVKIKDGNNEVSKKVIIK